MNTIFSNRYLYIKVTLLMLTVAFLCFYSYREESAEVTLGDCMADPGYFDKTLLDIGGGAKVGRVGKDGFELLKGENKIWVKGVAEGLGVNEYINVKAVFHKEGYLHLGQAHVLKWRRLKIVLSVIPVLVIAGLFLRAYRVRLHWPIFVER
jgi:hypothetical protein